MDRKKIIATAVALVLTVSGGVSALFLTLGAASSATTPADTTEIVEFVDAAGNPLPAATTGVAPTATAPPYEEYEDDDDYEDDEYGDDDDDYEDEDDDDDDDD